jgi:DNA-binding transcriptional MerR regulator
MPAVERKGYLASDIAREAGVPTHRVQYICRTRNIQPQQRCGTFRLFSDSDRQFIQAELRRIAAEREELSLA